MPSILLVPLGCCFPKSIYSPSRMEGNVLASVCLFSVLVSVFHWGLCFLDFMWNSECPDGKTRDMEIGVFLFEQGYGASSVSEP
jgi:hypothetical protein